MDAILSNARAQELKLGPNGGLIYCMEYVVEHMDWLEEQLQDYGAPSIVQVSSRDSSDAFARTGDDYLIFDCPGQVRAARIRSRRGSASCSG